MWVIVCMIVCVRARVRTCMPQQMYGGPRTTWGSWFSFHHVSLKDWTQAIRLGGSAFNHWVILLFCVQCFISYQQHQSCWSFLVFLFIKTRFLILQAGFKLVMEQRMILNFWPSCPYLLNVGITQFYALLHRMEPKILCVLHKHYWVDVQLQCCSLTVLSDHQESIAFYIY